MDGPFPDETIRRPPAAPGWMISFADLLSLLLAFFVMLFATTSISEPDWQRMVAPISTYLTGHRLAPPGVALTPLASEPQHDSGYIAALLDRLIVDSAALKGARLEHRDHMLALLLPAEAGRADIQPAPLGDLGRLLGGLDNKVEILVHGGADLSPAGTPVGDWPRVVTRALTLAGRLSQVSDGRPVGASAMLDLSGGQQAEQIELDILDVAEVDHHAAP
jgi:chemotaxis protein MotB